MLRLEQRPKPEKPRKRLVHLQQYLSTLGKQSALYSTATALVSGGALTFLVAILLSCATIPGWSYSFGKLCLIVGNGFIAALGIAMMWLAVNLFIAAKKIAPVELLTRHNAGSLTASESLLRGSDQPEPAAHAELLRAASHGPKTPPHQLLRAAQDDRQDV